MTEPSAPEPTLAEVQAEYPEWSVREGVLYFAVNEATGEQVRGEDPLDLRDQIKAAEARAAAGGNFGYTGNL